MRVRNIEIDTLRGIACILLVSYHVIGSTPNVGLKLSGGYLKEINEFLIYFRMPLFTFLSGYVYAYRPFKSGAFIFLKGKARRLLIPMLVVGTLFALIQENVPAANSSIDNWYLIHIIPYAHFWFIESLFLIFVLIIPLEHFKILENKALVLIIFFIASLIYLSDFVYPWFSISGAIYLLPYFILGMSISRFTLTQKYNTYWGVFLLFVVIVLFVLFGLMDSDFNNVGKRTIFALVIGSIGCTALLITKIRIMWVSIIGIYSYSIYLFHVFFTAASRIFLVEFGVADTIFLFSAGLIIGIIGPILVELLFNRYSFSRVLFLGKTASRHRHC